MDDTGCHEDNEETRRLVERYPFIHLECNSHNLGSLAACWNKLTQLLNTEITVLLSVDVMAYPYWLDALVQALRDNPHTGMMGYWMPTFPAMPWFRERIQTEVVGQGSHSSGCCFGFRKQVYSEVGGFDDHFIFGMEEVDFGLRCIQRGYVNYMVAGPRPIETYPLMYHGKVVGATPSKYFTRNAKHLASEASKNVFAEKWGEPYSGDLCDRVWRKAQFKGNPLYARGAILTAPPRPW